MSDSEVFGERPGWVDGEPIPAPPGARSERDLSAELGYSADTYREGPLAEERGLLALRSPAPIPDHGEQLVAVRAAIASFRVNAAMWRRSGFLDAGTAIDWRADVLEHVLRRLIREGADGS